MEKAGETGVTEVVNIRNEDMEKVIDQDINPFEDGAATVEIHEDLKCNSSKYYMKMEQRSNKVLAVLGLMCIVLVIIISVYYLA
ncbi:uncharacterized protein LOC143769561 isoform X2 [Ranitomeya variabilis]|uniref:uncharacterized protein LOC143769561 isoform X2 n=1 Tax=Ranitomeya variabilis TaxID=490064 RepID=UPI0040576089